MKSDKSKKKVLSLLEQTIASADFSSSEGFLEFRKAFNEQIDSFETEVLGVNEVDQITAEMVELLVTDENSGRFFRRTLPLSFRENDNGLRLIGESLDGSITEIAFISGTAVDKIKNLTGHGPDESRCND